MQPIDTAWKAFFSTFASIFLVVFLAESGDKTQLTTLAMAANRRARWAVFLGSALVVISMLTVLSCEFLLKFVNIRFIKYATGLLFLVIGTIILVGR